MKKPESQGVESEVVERSETRRSGDERPRMEQHDRYEQREQDSDRVEQRMESRVSITERTVSSWISLPIDIDPALRKELVHQWNTNFTQTASILDRDRDKPKS